MFLRCNRRKKDGKDHEYWSVVEIREYIKNQEQEDQRLDQLGPWS